MNPLSSTRLAPYRAGTPAAQPDDAPCVVLSFDIEEHYRIEAASGLTVGVDSQERYRRRMEAATHWILEMLAARYVKATFYVVGELAHLTPDLVRAIADAGHEVGSHGWDHRSVLAMSPGEFRLDVRKSKEALEDVTGRPVLGYRAPTFSILARNAWALEVLVEEGYQYDSSIYPVRHDRYGVPDAPLTPFVVPTAAGPIVELPPLALRLWGMNMPVGGGGYFRLFPQWLMRRGINQMGQRGPSAPAMLYFHPWEFDPGQEQLPLSMLSRWRTYSGIEGSRERLERLVDRGYRFRRASDVALEGTGELPAFGLLSGVPALA